MNDTTNKTEFKDIFEAYEYLENLEYQLVASGVKDGNCWYGWSKINHPMIILIENYKTNACEIKEP